MRDQPPTDVPTPARYFVIAGLCAAAAIAYIQRNCIAVAEKTIRLELGLSLDQMSLVMSGFFITYAAFQIPAGWWGDRAGSRRSLTVYSAVWSLAAGLLALGNGFASLLLYRSLGGAAQAGIFPCSAKTISLWFPRVRRAIASGYLGGFMSVGGALGAFWTGLLLPVIGWRWTVALFTLPGLVWSAWFWWWFRDRPEEHSDVNAAELGVIRGDSEVMPAHGAIEPTPWGAIAGNVTIWWISAQQFFRAAGYMFFGSWFATFLQETREVTTQQSGVLTSLPLLAVVVGSPAGGYVSDWVLEVTGSARMSRQGVAVAAMVGCAVLIVLSYFVTQPLTAVLLITAGSFCASFGGPCAYAATIDVSGRHVAAVFSLMNMCGNIGAVAFPPAAALLVRHTGEWDLVLFLFAALYFAAAVCWLLVDPDDRVAARSQSTLENR